MKQFTTPDQTAKLIELGVEKPKGWCAEGISSHLHMYKRREDDEGFNYSIGELIEMLDGVSELEITRYGSGWEVGDELRAFTGEELIDSLFDMIVKLKEDKIL